MRKLLLSLLVVLSLFIITGCSKDASEADAQRISNALHDRGFLSDKDRFIEKYTERNYRNESWWTTTYYIYKRNNSLMALYYEEVNSTNSDCDFRVYMYSNVKENTNYADMGDGYYSEENEKYSIYTTGLTTFCVKDKSFLFFHKYEITPIKYQ